MCNDSWLSCCITPIKIESLTNNANRYRTLILMVLCPNLHNLDTLLIKTTKHNYNIPQTPPTSHSIPPAKFSGKAFSSQRYEICLRYQLNCSTWRACQLGDIYQVFVKFVVTQYEGAQRSGYLHPQALAHSSIARSLYCSSTSKWYSYCIHKHLMPPSHLALANTRWGALKSISHLRG